MQTFLPYPDFFIGARALDQRRPGKRRVETVRVYGLDMCEVCISTGRADTTAATMRADVATARGSP